MNRPVDVSPRAALPKGERTSYEKALDATLEALSLAAVAKLQDRDDHFRFQEVQKLGRIGEAVGRLKARLSNRVEDYVNPGRRNHGRNGPWGYGGLGARVGGLGGVDPLLDDGLDPAQPMYGPGLPVIRGPRAQDDGDPFAMFRNYLDGLKEAVTDKGDTEMKKLEKLNELKSLLDNGEWNDEQRKLLEERRDAIFADLQKGNEPDAAAPPAPPKPPIDLVARCVTPGCGTAHDGDWRADDGRPLDCDVCDGPMFWAPPDAQVPPGNGEAAPAWAAAQDAHAHDEILDGPRHANFVCCDADVNPNQYP